MGVLGLGFVTLLILFVKSDRRSQKYADMLDEAAFDRSKLIDVVQKNTEASIGLTNKLTEMNRTQNKIYGVIDKLDRRLDSDRCPFLDKERNPT